MTDRRAAVHFECEPGLQRSKAARKIGPVITGPRRARSQASQFLSQIRSRGGKGLAMQPAVAHQNESGVIGHLAPLMKIECQRVRAFYALEPRRQIRSQNRQRAIRAVDVEPEPLARAEAGKGVEVGGGPGVP